MKVSALKLLVFLGFIALILSAAACNRGYGCPSDFSVDAMESPAPDSPGC